jgi:hypothetical protein
MSDKEQLAVVGKAIIKAVNETPAKTAPITVEFAKKGGEWDISNIDDVQAKVLKELDAFLEGYYGRYGDLLESSEGGKLSALQKGIQGMTASQADILVAYWNSVRGYTASIDSKMDLVLANMSVGAENNPMLGQLIAQTSVLNNIYSFLQSMTTAAPTASQFSGRVWKSSM